MTTSTLDPSTRRRSLGPGAATALQAIILITFMAASSAPSPIYRIYQQQWDLAPSTLTILFGVYAASLLVALLVVGRISDHVGRKPTVLAALIGVSLAMVLFLVAENAGTVLVARVVQGLATGTATGALAAGLLDTARAHGGLINSVSPVAGMALGALGASLLVEFAPIPMRLVFLLLLVAFIGQAFALTVLPETAARRPGAVASLRPRIGVPPRARRTLFLVGPAAVAAWALGGFYLSLGPSLAQLVTGSDSALTGGLLVFTLTSSGAVAVFLLRSAAPRRLIRIGSSALLGGLAITLLGVSMGSALLFYPGTVLAGIGFGCGFLGAMRTLIPLAEPHERAGLMSTFYIVCYLGNCVPAVIAGIAANSIGVPAATGYFGAAVILLALVAFLGTLLRQDTPSTNPPPAA
ncbi:MFS transporter [Actinoalloteichus hymeniacidonis]|uniref:Arabinose efflux permease family protein n=1 Tax=Actinoalloteichus hymeniacidonis TaxID=340345 RepID=A0AAC9MYA4_9PSEU|nr:MFS transporter [Actinoalloteichus hymeniacidonis]AOS64198.1 arabinose efflux permease family protein [Actinoalloteichus hymeniacidonis]MBB5907734.1 MFS family permease [Actinoalloteichus hymeniacidonis]